MLYQLRHAVHEYVPQRCAIVCILKIKRQFNLHQTIHHRKRGEYTWEKLVGLEAQTTGLDTHVVTALLDDLIHRTDPSQNPRCASTSNEPHQTVQPKVYVFVSENFSMSTRGRLAVGNIPLVMKVLSERHLMSRGNLGVAMRACLRARYLFCVVACWMAMNPYKNAMHGTDAKIIKRVVDCSCSTFLARQSNRRL